jgi:hypothetical protein
MMNSTNATRADCANSALAKDQITNGPIFSPITPERNEFADVANRFAARGHDLIRVDNDSPCRYFICTRGRSLMVTSWLAVKTLLVHIGRSA